MITIANADARHIPLPDQSVQCVVTSPPYWGLRDYGTAKWEGGSEGCDHATRDATRDATSTLVGTSNKEGFALNHYKDICRKCGARRIDAQIGLEPTPAAYVAHLVAVMRECWRVLKDDGTLWLNLGDSYARQAGSDYSKKTDSGMKTGRTGREKELFKQGNNKPPEGLKEKDLCGIPWRVAFALQDDGWYLRSDIIWHKPNPMPESVTDRCTKAHEYVFLLTKQARYYYDAEAIKEPIAEGTAERYAYGFNSPDKKREIVETGKWHTGNNGRDNLQGDMQLRNGRNRRSVWTVATSPYSGAHFATFPPALIEPMILAGSRRGDVVLDPFGGSGTTGQVAVKHGRRAVLLDLNTKYIDLQFDRTSGVQITMPV